MMKVESIHYNHHTGIVTAEPHPGGVKYTVTEDATALDVTAGDDVRVHVDDELTHVETLSAQPLLVRESDDDYGTVTVRTPRAPEHADASFKP